MKPARQMILIPAFEELPEAEIPICRVEAARLLWSANARCLATRIEIAVPRPVMAAGARRIVCISKG